MKTLFTLWIIDPRSAIKSLMLYINNKTKGFFSAEFLFILHPKPEFPFLASLYSFNLLFMYSRPSSASQDWDWVSSNICPCTQWKLYFHNEELKTKSHVFYHLPSLLSLRILSLFQINSLYFSPWVQNLIHSPTCISV